MSRVDYYISLLKSKILSEEDITEICKEFNLMPPSFTNSHDWIFGMMSREILRKREEQRFKECLKKFPDSTGLDLKKLKIQINLSGRTPEQQRNDMFKIMDDAHTKHEESKSEEEKLFPDITFKELQDEEIRKGTETGKMYQKMRDQADEMNKELCMVCDKPRDIDLRGFITIPDSDGKIYKVHYECVLKLIKVYLDGKKIRG